MRHGVWEMDCPSGRFSWNSQLQEIHALPPGSLGGTKSDWESSIHPDDLPKVRTELDEFLGGNRAQSIQNFRVGAAVGDTRAITAFIHALRDPEGRALKLIGFEIDHPEENDLRENLHQIEERTRLALAGSNDAIWDWNLLTNEVYRDERYAEMLGYAPGEFRFPHRILSLLGHPDDQRRVEAALGDCVAGRVPFFRCEYRMRHKDGRWIWVLGRGKVVARDANGRALRIVGTLSDITARKQLEDRLQHSEELSIQISRLAQIGAWEWNVTNGRMTWSPEMYRIHEVELGFEPTLTKALDFFPPLARASLEEAIDYAVHHGTSFDFELPLLTARQRNLTLRVQGSAEVTNGRTVRVYGAYQDISDRRAADDTRRKLEAQLFQAQKMETLGTLAGGIAHDFNNLLTGILGYQELALEALPEDHPVRTYMGAAKDASLRARELVDQILTFSRQSGMEKVPVSLVQLVEDARKFLRATVPASIGIEVEMAPDCGQIMADATQIHQVLLNLGSNAAHAMRAKGGKIVLTLRPVELDGTGLPPLVSLAPGRYLKLTFQDSGHGMDPATMKRIFDPFFTTKGVGEGTGLGLAVVHGIIDSHRGAITVESTPNVGSTFTIYLPAAEEEDSAPAEASAPPSQGHGQLVAVIDDDATVRRIVEMALTKGGYRVETYSSPSHCLETMRSNPEGYALLLTDQTMPVLKGTELAAEIRTFAPKLPILIMSGYFSRISAEKLAVLGHVSLLPKPFTSAELTQAVDRALS